MFKDSNVSFLNFLSVPYPGPKLPQNPNDTVSHISSIICRNGLA